MTMRNGLVVPASGIRCMLMRGGTSKGAYFLADDLPPDPASRDIVLLAVMGSPDPRQIDGIGGAPPPPPQAAGGSPPAAPRAELDYLFLSGVGESPPVTAQQQRRDGPCRRWPVP